MKNPTMGLRPVAVSRWLWLPLAVFSWFAATAWIRPLAMPDEGRYVGVMWEMLRSGNWAVPTLDGMPFFHKPPLFYWIGAIAMKALGPSVWAARMPSMLGATFVALTLYAFALKWRGEHFAGRCLVVLATMPFLYFGAQFANMDMLVAACIGMTVLLAADSVLSRQQDARHSRRVLYLAYAVAALGVLAKGLIGAVLPGAIMVCWLLAARRPRLIVSLISPIGIGLFLLIAAPWLVAMQARYPNFFDYFIVEQHFRRFAAGGFNNVQPFWFYLPVLLLLTLPWSLALPAAIRRWKTETPGEQPSIEMLMLCWLAVVVVFFSLPQSKLVGYIIPAVPPLAWLLSAALVEARGRNVLRRHFSAIAGSTAVASLAIVIAFAFFAADSTRTVARALASQRSVSEPVVFLNAYHYDIPFYARLTEPVIVVNGWTKPDIAKHDNWAKELFDEARFAPSLAASTLIEAPDLAGVIQRSPGVWLIGPHGARDVPKNARLVTQSHDLDLWHVTRAPDPK